MMLRVASAAVLAPIAVILVILGGTPYYLGVTVMCLAAVWEFTNLLGLAAGQTVVHAPWRYAAGAGTAVVLFGVFFEHYREGAAQLCGAGVLALSLAVLVFGGAPAKRFLLWALGIASVLYIAGLGLHFLLLRETSQGLTWTLLACLVTWSTDIGALFAGRQFGKHPFFHLISPKKTLEGAAGGLAAGMIAALLVIVAGGLHVPVVAGLLIGITVSAIAQIGDLVESLAKREAGVKDSGSIIPGHGGVLDRIDSLLFAVALTYYWRLLFL